MNADLWAAAHSPLLWASLLFAAGYFVATRRRSRRAAVVGLLAVVLTAQLEALKLAGVGYWNMLSDLGVPGPEPLRSLSSLTEVGHMALVNGLLVVAVLVGRRPAAVVH